MTCFGGREEQIYQLEITVQRLRPTKHEFECLFGGVAPDIHLSCLKLPKFIVTQPSEHALCNMEDYNEVDGIYYGAGLSCLFARKPRDIVADMKACNLMVRIFKKCELFHVAQVDIPMKGCFCDQMTMVDNDDAHKPKPFEINGLYDIVDVGENYLGSIKLHLRLSLLGQYVITNYELRENDCLYKYKKGPELIVTSVKEEENEDRRLKAISIMITPDNHESTKLTSSNLTDQVKKRQGKNSQSTIIDARRMRGGGCGAQFLEGFTKTPDSRRLMAGGCGEIYSDAGCCGGRSGASQVNNIIEFGDDFKQWNTSVGPAYLAQNKCNMKNVEKNNVQFNCPDNQQPLDAMLRKKGNSVCSKKPCMGTNCLIKAFNDAQDFVNSIGKVPGLAGLGIIESPYFGQAKETKTIKSEFKPTPNKAPEIASTNRNADNPRKSNQSTPFPSNNKSLVQEGNATFPDSQSIAQSKQKKSEKVEKQKDVENLPPPAPANEDAPCGDPTCKSKPKKNTTEEGTSHTNEKTDNQDKNPSHKTNRGRAPPQQAGEKSQKSKNPKQFVYSYGNSYPKSVYGHKDCNSVRPLVPARMGWMWNKTDTIGHLKPRTGWKPGAISVQMRDLLKEARDGFFKQKSRPVSAPTNSKGAKGKPQKTISSFAMMKGAQEDENEEEVEFPPTLHIHRKDGVYYVTMYPIRNENDTDKLDEPINPLQFKIVKSKTSIASSSTASDMEIEFSPPAAVNRLKKKPNVVHVDTQVQQQEILDACKRPSDGKKGDKNGKQNGKNKKK
ncbi:uncharacterized protein LOC106653798 [Trichogramma pretiosum]|uniref:uncharacterized protein LOC106653798 n=1 Tax=Trichogramma pretiosum TaxID=7493 RepID=UPI000C71B113|nr:uncharacterized protein LOC106653798 [Trichogramma pretiosum]